MIEGFYIVFKLYFMCV